MVLSHDITLTIMVEIKKDNYNKYWQVITATGTLTPLLHEAKWYDHFRKSLEFFLKVNILLKYGPGIQPLSICPMKAKVYIKSFKAYL